MMKNYMPLIVLSAVLGLCVAGVIANQKSSPEMVAESGQPADGNSDSVFITVPSQNESYLSEPSDPEADVVTDGKARAYFASGCFWCVEAIYESVKGVEESISGYSGGRTKNPTYDSSNTGRTGHAEAVEIIYDPSVVSFATLVDVYFGSQNVTQKNGQGPDNGSQYRSIIFYQNEAQKKIIDERIESLNEQLRRGKVAAEVKPFEKFWIGEDYHQNYERLHPNDPYVRAVSVPRLLRFQKKFPHLLKDSAKH